jgi:hypothetical protein
VKTFSIDARAILTLGRDSIKDHKTALLELVKNSYDADATKVEIEIICATSSQYIRVADNGCGMTEDEVDKYWLRIGYSEKRNNRFSNRQRRKTGEKGIGRISADRLGASLQLTTQAKNHNVFGLKVNWDDFNVEGKDLSTIPIKVLKNPNINIPSHNGTDEHSGTELVIRELRQKWTQSNIEDFYTELSILTPPFKQTIRDFEIYLKTDVTKEFQGRIESPFYQTAEIELNAKWNGTDIAYTITDRYSKENSKPQEKRIDYKKLVQKTSESETRNLSSYPHLGPFSISLLFYPREARLLEGTEFRLSDLREFLDKNSGVKIYRDFVRVKPYGNPNEPEGDWLGLAERKTREPAGVSRPTWRVGANQLVGAVFVSRDANPHLIDSSAREGLIQDEEFNNLRSIVLGCLTLLEAYRHKEYTEREVQEEKPVPAQAVESLRKELDVLRSDLKTVTKGLPRSLHKPVIRTLDQVISVTEKTKEVEKALEEMASEGRILRGLATIGIASAVFGHETKSSVSEFISATYTASRLLKGKQPNIESIIGELEKAIKYADHVRSWGAFALARIQRDKRRKRKVDISKVVMETIQDVDPIFKAASIRVIPRLDSITGRTFAMDVESILLNLLTNAYAACQQIRRPRTIEVSLTEKSHRGTKGFELAVGDSGTGVEEKFKTRIWDPLFTTKVDKEGRQVGTGLGLTIVRSIVDELGGEKEVGDDSKLKGARFTIWLPSGG